jgi:hypothetical protein
MGVYRVRGTLHLKPDSVLIGLAPSITVLAVNDDDLNFAGNGDPIPIVESSTGGHEILTGIGIFAGDSTPRAAGLVWHSGAYSFVQDVNFSAGLRPSVHLAPKYPRHELGEKRPDRRGSQYPSLWIRGGGGIFRDIWTADTTAIVGLRVENTQTPSVAYQISCEHHMRNEVQFDHGSNWTVYALQTEEEMPNGAEATPLELIDSTNITFANLFDYRVSRSVIPHFAAIEATGSDKIRFANMHNFSMTRLAFDNSIVDRTRDVAVRTHDFTTFFLDHTVKPGLPLQIPGVFEPRASLVRLTNPGSFSNIAGLTVDEDGRLFFTDAAAHQVFGWNEEERGATHLSQAIDSPITLCYAGNGTFLAIGADKSVWAISETDGHTQKLAGEDPRANTTLLLPKGFHNDVGTVQRMVGHQGYVYAPRSNMAITGMVENEQRSFFYAPGTQTAIMSGGSWKGLLQAIQLSPFQVGESRYGVSEEDDKIYRLTLDSLQLLTAVSFISRSGTSVVSDFAGNIYVAGAQLFIYSPKGTLLGTLEIPERPSSLTFGGADHRTLYIGARTSLYEIRTATRGE